MIVPLSGGGLLAGIAMAAKSINPGIHVVGISLERSPAMLESLKAGNTCSGGGKKLHCRFPFRAASAPTIGTHSNWWRQFTDEHLLVSEKEIKDGMFYIFDKYRLIVEGAAAVAWGLLLSQKIHVKGKTGGYLLSGNSINSDEYIRIVQDRLTHGTAVTYMPTSC